MNVRDAQIAVAEAEQKLSEARHQLADSLAADGWRLMSSHQAEDGSVRNAVYVRELGDGSTETARLEGILAEAAA